MIRHCYYRGHLDENSKNSKSNGPPVKNLYDSLGENAELPEQLVHIWGVLGGHLLDVPTHPPHHTQDPIRIHTPRYGRKKDWLPEVYCSGYDIVVEGIKC